MYRPFLCVIQNCDSTTINNQSVDQFTALIYTTPTSSSSPTGNRNHRVEVPGISTTTTAASTSPSSPTLNPTDDLLTGWAAESHLIIDTIYDMTILKSMTTFIREVVALENMSNIQEPLLTILLNGKLSVVRYILVYTDIGYHYLKLCMAVSSYMCIYVCISPHQCPSPPYLETLLPLLLTLL